MAQRVKVSTYIKNVAKSFGYAAGDVFTEYNPTVTKLFKDTKETSQSLYQEIKDFTNEKKGSPEEQDLKSGGFVKNTIDNLMDDLKTGQWYNKARQEALSNDQMSAMLGDDFNFDFDDSDDWGDDWDSDDVSTDSKAEISQTAKSTGAIIAGMDSVGYSVANTVNKGMSRSASAIIASQLNSNKALYDLNVKGFSNINKAIMAVDNSINTIAKLGEPLTAHMQNSVTFYSTTTDTLNQMNQTLKEIAKAVNPPTVNNRNFKEVKGSFSDIFGSDGLDIGSYAQMIKDNLAEYKDIGGMIGNYLKGYKKNFSLGAVGMQQLIKSAIPEVAKESMKQLNEAIKGGLGAALVKARSDANNNLIGSFLSDIFFPKDAYKNKINNSNYEKGKVAWDGISRKALTEVIPVSLMKIYSAISGQPEMRYDYDKGKFVKMSGIKTEFNRMRQMYIESSGDKFRDDALAAANEAKLTSAQKKDIERYFEEIFSSGDYDQIVNIRSHNLNPAAEQILLKVQAKYKKEHKFNSTITNIQTGREDWGNYLRALEASGDSIFANLNNWEEEQKKQQTGGLSNIITDTKDRYNHTPFFYLQGIYEYTGYLANNIEYLSGKSNRVNKFEIRRNRGQLSTGDYRNMTSNGIIIPNVAGGTTGEHTVRSSNEARDAIKENNMTDEEKKLYQSKKKIKEKKDNASNKFKQWMKDHGLDVTNPIARVIQAPMMAMSDMLNKLTDSIQDLVWGTNEDGTHKGIMQRLEEKWKDFWGNKGRGGKWLDKFLGRKDEEGNRKGGFFSDFIDETKASLNKVKDEVKDTFGEMIFGKKGYAEKKEKKRQQKMKEDLKERMNSMDQNAAQNAFSRNYNTAPTTFLQNINTSTAKAIARNRRKNNKKDSGSGWISLFGGDSGLDSEEEEDGVVKIKVLNAKSLKRYIRNRQIKSERKKEENREKKGRGEGYGVLGAIKSLGDWMQSAFSKTIADIAGKDDKDKKRIQNKTDVFMKNLGIDMNQNKGAMGAGALIGAGASLLTGGIVGPLFGAAAGAGIGLLTKSESLQNTLFGSPKYPKNATAKQKTEIDEKYNKSLKGRLKNMFQNQMPSIGKGAAVGGIAGLLLGHPILGAFAGSAVGFINSSNNAKEFLFGKYETVTDKDGRQITRRSKWLGRVTDRLKKAAPNMAVGAGIGALFGPFGMVGNLLVGSAAGFLTTSDRFHDWMFGDKKNNKKGFVDLLKDKIFNNVDSIFHNFTNRWKQRFSNFGKKIWNGIKGRWEDRVKKYKDKSDNSILTKIAGITDKVVKAPVNAVGGILNRRAKANERKNLNSGYMVWDSKNKRNLYASERVQLREAQGYNQNTSAAKIDKAIASAKNRDELIELQNALKDLEDPGRIYKRYHNKAVNELYRVCEENGLRSKHAEKIVKYCNGENGESRAIEYLKGLNAKEAFSELPPDKTPEDAINAISKGISECVKAIQKAKNDKNITKNTEQMLQQKYGINAKYANLNNADAAIKNELDHNEKYKEKTDEEKEQDKLANNSDETVSLLQQILDAIKGTKEAGEKAFEDKQNDNTPGRYTTSVDTKGKLRYYKYDENGKKTRVTDQEGREGIHGQRTAGEVAYDTTQSAKHGVGTAARVAGRGISGAARGVAHGAQWVGGEVAATAENIGERNEAARNRASLESEIDADQNIKNGNYTGGFWSRKYRGFKNRLARIGGRFKGFFGGDRQVLREKNGKIILDKYGLPFFADDTNKINQYKKKYPQYADKLDEALELVNGQDASGSGSGLYGAGIGSVLATIGKGALKVGKGIGKGAVALGKGAVKVGKAAAPVVGKVAKGVGGAVKAGAQGLKNFFQNHQAGSEVVQGGADNGGADLGTSAAAIGGAMGGTGGGPATPGRNKKKFVYDMFGGVHQITVNEQGEEIEDSRDSDTRKSNQAIASFKQSIANISTTISDKLSGIAAAVASLKGGIVGTEKKEGLLDKLGNLFGNGGQGLSSILGNGLKGLLSDAIFIKLFTGIFDGSLNKFFSKLTSIPFLKGNDTGSKGTQADNNVGIVTDKNGKEHEVKKDKKGHYITDKNGNFIDAKTGKPISGNVKTYGRNGSLSHNATINAIVNTAKGKSSFGSKILHRYANKKKPTLLSRALKKAETGLGNLKDQLLNPGIVSDSKLYKAKTGVDLASSRATQADTKARILAEHPEYAEKLGIKVADNADDATKGAGKISKLINKVKNSKFGAKAAKIFNKSAAEGGAKAATKATQTAEKASNVINKAAEGAMGEAKKATIWEKLVTQLKKFGERISSSKLIAHLHPSLAGKGKEITNKLGEYISKAVTKMKNGVVGKVFRGLVKAAPFISLAQDIGTAVNIFSGGAESVLGITTKATIGQKCVAALIGILNNHIPVISLIFDTKTLVNIMVAILTKVCPDLPGLKKLNKERKSAKEEVTEYNAKHGTDYDIETYNEKVKNRIGIGTRIKHGVSDLFTNTGAKIKKAFSKKDKKKSKKKKTSTKNRYKITKVEAQELLADKLGMSAVGDQYYSSKSGKYYSVKEYNNLVNLVMANGGKGLDQLVKINDTRSALSGTFSKKNKKKKGVTLSGLLSNAKDKINDKIIEKGGEDDAKKFKQKKELLKKYAAAGDITSIVKLKVNDFSGSMKFIYASALRIAKQQYTQLATTNMMLSPFKKLTKQTAKDSDDTVKQAKKGTGFFGKIKSFFTGGGSNSNSGAGSGLYGAGFVSQFDPQYSDKSFAGSNIADLGCGPAVASMASGGSLSMNSAINAASGYTNSSGTNINYFKKVFGSKAHLIPGADVADEFGGSSGTILLGRDENNTSKDFSPFGPRNHYVYAQKGPAGTVLVNDPEQSGPRLYPNSILNSVEAGVDLSGGGSKKKKKGKGKDSSSDKSSDGSKEMSRYQAIWEYLKGLGYSNTAAAAIMGCWNSESANKPNRVEGDYMKSYPGTDKVLASNESANSYTVNTLFPAYAKSGVRINKKAYKGDASLGQSKYYYPGVGIAAWTGPAASRLWDYAKKKGEDWKSLAAQMDFFTNGPGKPSKKYNKGLEGQGNLKSAVTYWYDKYEMGGSSTAHSVHPDWVTQRYKAAKDILAKYKGDKNTIKLEDMKNIKLTDLNSSAGIASSGGVDSSSGSSDSQEDKRGGIFGAFDIFGNALNSILNGGNDSSSGDSRSDGSGLDETSVAGNGTAKSAIDIAKSQIGYQEKKSNKDLDKPHANVGSNNYTKYGAYTGANGLAWCASFVSWVMNQTVGGDKKKLNKLLRGPQSASVSGLWSNFKNANAMSKTPQPGDIIIYKNGSSHTGLVESVDTAKKTFNSIEGNTSGGAKGYSRDGGQVAEKTGRPWTYKPVTGFGRPNWNAVSDGSSGDSNKKDAKKSGSGSGLVHSYDEFIAKASNSTGKLLKLRPGSNMYAGKSGIGKGGSNGGFDKGLSHDAFNSIGALVTTGVSSPSKSSSKAPSNNTGIPTDILVQYMKAQINSLNVIVQYITNIDDKAEYIEKIYDTVAAGQGGNNKTSAAANKTINEQTDQEISKDDVDSAFANLKSMTSVLADIAKG